MKRDVTYSRGKLRRIVCASIVAGLCAFSVATLHGQQSPQLYSPDGKFLGNLNANRFDYSPDSVNNPFGRYESKYSPESARNPLASGGKVPRVYSHDGKYLGDYSANRLNPSSVSNKLGRFDSRLSPESIRNPLGKYRSPLSPSSATNPFATGGESKNEHERNRKGRAGSR